MSDSALDFGALRTVSPSLEPLALQETKLYLRVEHDDEDDLIEQLIVAAREAAEAHTGLSLITQTWQLSIADSVSCNVSLPHGPVQSVSSVVLTDRDGNETPLAAAAYRLNAARDGLTLVSAQLAWRIVITYVAGFGAAADDVPASLKQGMLAHIGALYERRGDASVSLPAQSQALYAAWRRVRL